MKKNYWLVLVVILALILAACGDDDDSEDSPSNEEVTEIQTMHVFAAASLTDAFEELATQFEERGGVDIQLNFASSSALATQINEGAPSDVFASANERQMQNVKDAGNTTSDPLTFAKNRLVAVVFGETPFDSLDDLAGDGVKVVFAAPDVPVRDYTDQSLAALAESPDYGAAFRDNVLANLVSEEADVRAVVLKVSLGEADAGIVYASDITPDIKDTVRVIDIPDEYNVIATYPIAATSDSTLAADFIAYVLSADGQAVLQKWGFSPAQ